MDGNIIDIKRFTIHDGPGIRSTVFLKGCALRCAWCHNPEGEENSVDLWYFPRQCIRCRACLGACPADALRADEEGEAFIRVNRQRCVKCGLCVQACPTTALSFDGQRLSSDEVVATLLRDEQFYRQSGGGITISGGDPLVQHQFAVEIMRRCKTAGLHTAIETCLQGPWNIVETFLPVTDLFIVDLKLADARQHQKYTGQGNELIRQNYARLAGLGRDLLTRIPLIPRVTALPENISAIAQFVRECNPGGRVELINFNPLAESKYLLMNRDQSFFRNMAPLGVPELEEFWGIIETEGLAVVREHTL
ncbi:MAG TPA: glycyl-radical enzyme activating protein [Rectinemataceae bacterium]|nr:glycyl-radical enzyme activating protein [Rectinemataceae bacterium]